jgi:hypothetical protein
MAFSGRAVVEGEIIADGPLGAPASRRLFPERPPTFAEPPLEDESSSYKTAPDAGLKSNLPETTPHFSTDPAETTHNFSTNPLKQPLISA